MADFIPHFCTGVGCESMHAGRGESDEVRVAKINADRDIEVARIQRSETRIETEAATEQTETEAAAQVETAVAEAVVTTAMLAAVPAGEPEETEPEEAPVIVTEPEELADEIPAPEETEHEPVAHSKGFWSGYATR